ncbi:hypothetical protein CERSUDRAFT_154048 [Gelatoporia subvermispora B]|uniref:Velvet domain-containing protein n=1 Tax=Ceriporiopsis subvermispora (strain B) TaxID=914234 RepID=M2QZ27_CERS8|nr:hypothetical protein CERSUDRAFT_154048 [Gelatoporia subvermispora B]
MQRDFQSDLCHHWMGTSAIGEFITFMTGELTGHTVRAKLEELQKPVLGRKYSDGSGRPLDPPPVVRVRLFHIDNPGTPDEHEEELKCEEIIDYGLTCYVDLFPIASASRASGDIHVPDASVSSPTQSMFPQGNTEAVNVVPVRPQATTAPPSDVIAFFDKHAITESSNHTDWLIGKRFVEACMIQYHGEQMLVFVFPAIAVQLQGIFTLRYRAFSLFAKAAGEHGTPIIAECYSWPFHVYSNKDFPGFRASTELTKHLAALGIRTRVREHDQKRRDVANNGQAEDSQSHHRDTDGGAVRAEQPDEDDSYGTSGND